MQSIVRAIALRNEQQCMAFELETGMRMTAAADPFAVARKHLGIPAKDKRDKQEVYDAFVDALPGLLDRCNNQV